MRVTTTKSKNSESFYITKSYKNNAGKSTSKIIRKLGTLQELSQELNTDRDGVMKWANEQAKIETEKYQLENENQSTIVPFYSNRQLEFNKQKFLMGGYLFLQSVYYELKFDQICKKIKAKYSYEYDLNAILSDLIYTRILEPDSKRSSFKTAQKFLEAPSYELYDVYRALSVLANECDFIQAEVYKNSGFVTKRNDKILYYDCTNYYFEIQQEENSKKYGKSKEHRPNPIVQMGLFTDGDGIPLAFSLFPGNQNEQQSVKPLEKKILQEFGCQKFIYCSDSGLGFESNREFNSIGERAFIVTQSIKKLPKDEREWALNGLDFRRITDDKKIDSIKNISDDSSLFYKEIPYTTKKIHQRLIVTYSPKFAAYQKAVRENQIERANRIIESGSLKRQCKNPNDPARFVNKIAVTQEGEVAQKNVYSLNLNKIAEGEKYDGIYAVCTDLLDDHPLEIIKVSEGRWQIEACFRIMKTDFSARPVYVQREDRIKAHFLVCFLSLMIYRLLEKKLKKKYTCDEILDALKEMNFANIEDQGFMPLYSREKITDDLHEICTFRTDYQFISKQKMKEIQKKSKLR